MNANSIRVLLVDDHAVVREGYRVLLSNSRNIDVVAEAECGEDACRKYRKHNPNVVIMDLSLPGMGGLEAIRRITACDANARILAFSMHESLVFVEQALQAGANGYITKSSAPEVLIEAIRHIANGEVFIDQEIERQLAMQEAKGTGTPFSSLSTREFQVFCMLAQGASVAEIAQRVSLSYKTVANYSTRIKDKLKVNTAAGLARIAIRHGLIDA